MVQTPDELNVTGKPEDAVAATVKYELTEAVAGADLVTVMV